MSAIKKTMLGLTVKVSKAKDQDEIIENILKNRGVKTKKQKESFLSPDYDKDLNDPYLLGDMEEAVALIEETIENKKGILIYGDYDADGVCGATILYETFSVLGSKESSVYIPSRYEDGYGMNIPSLERAKDAGVKLVVTVDCGSANIKEIKWARDNGLNVVITDHHLAKGKFPNANAFINPHKKGDKYPFSGLCGAGVAFKLCVALLDRYREKGKSVPDKGWEKWFLDLVAIATVADVMPLLDENRAIVKYGLLVLSKTKRKGLRHLIKNCGYELTDEFDSFFLGFCIAPRINAAGRMDNARVSFDLLNSRSEEEARKLAFELESANKKRQEAVDMICKSVEKRSEIKDEAIFVGDETWMSGVVGIVAGKLAEKYKKPAFVYQKVGDKITGSARSVEPFNVVEILGEADSFLDRFGGHKQAAGFSADIKNEQEIKTNLIEAAKKAAKKGAPKKELLVDAALSENDISFEFVEKLEALRPYGEKNPEPLFCLKDVCIEKINFVGRDKRHASFLVSGHEKTYKGIAFGVAREVKSYVSEGDRVDIIFRLQKEEYRGEENITLNVRDMVVYGEAKRNAV